MPSGPPSLTDLRSALAHLDLADRLDAALHLSLPRSSSLREVSWRPEHLAWREATITPGRDLAAAAHALSQAGWSDLDEPLDLTAARWTWLKRLSRGSRVELAGTDIVFDGPRVWVDAVLPACIDEQIAMALQQQLDPPLLVSCQGIPAVIERSTGGHWRVERLSRRPVPVTSRGDAAEVIARRCGATSWHESPESLVLDIDGGRVHVPWRSEQAVHVATSPMPWWDTGSGDWTASGVDDTGRVWLRHQCGVRGWWEPFS